MQRDDGEADIYLPPNEMRAVLHKDRVKARVVRLDRRGRPEGRVVEIIERPEQPIVTSGTSVRSTRPFLSAGRTFSGSALASARGPGARHGLACPCRPCPCPCPGPPPGSVPRAA